MTHARCARPAADPVADVLHELRLDDSFYCRSDLTAPWAITIAERSCVSFHFVAEGTAWLERPEPLRLDAGDLVFLLRGPAHVIASAPGLPAPSIESLGMEPVGPRSARLRHGGGGDSTLLLCGGTALDPPDHPIRALLPDVLLLRGADAARRAWIQLSIATMREEVRAPWLGSETFVTRLVELLLLEAVRDWIERSPDARRGWLAALLDPRLGRVLALMHRRAQHPWTVPELAAEAGMSKSVFCERFRATVGVPPLQYLTRLRMQLAARWLRGPDASVAAVAARLGYDSEAAFSRAFKRVVGIAPGRARRVAPSAPSLAAGAAGW